MKQWILVFLFCIGSGLLFAKEKGEFLSEWNQVQPKYTVVSNGSTIGFPESESVELFESLLQIENSLYFQTKSKDKQVSIYEFELLTGKWNLKPWDKGKVLGWTECKGQIFIQTKSLLYALEKGTWNVQKEIPIPAKSSSWRDIVCSENQLYRLEKDQLEVVDLNSLERKPSLPLPMKSVQRIVKRKEGEILLYSSFSGNTIQLYSLSNQTKLKEWKIPTNHRALFKFTVLEPDRVLVFDPMTKIYGEWILFDDQFFSVNDGIETRSDAKAVRFSPIRSRLSYQVELLAKETIPETNIHIVLPKKDTYGQTLREETFTSPSQFGLDETGNRTLTISVPAMKEGETKRLTVYQGNLTRYKIHWKLSPELLVNREKAESQFPNEMLDGWFLKIDDPMVVSKRTELFQDKTSVKEILMETSKYVSSIPYKSGKFEAAPKVIEKNNGGCTEHSYVTMSLLRGIGMPTRLVWNYLPTESSDTMHLNHKYVEVWVDGYGWMPMEPLAPPRSKPGVTYARHLVFAVLPTPNHPKILGGDRLFQLSKESWAHRNSLQMKLKILKEEGEEGKEEDEEYQPSQKQNRSILSGEDIIVP